MDFDDLVIGAGMAGLAVASLLACSGRRVGVLEAHDVAGGYAHTFTMKDYRFCAQVHYVFGCGEGETVDRLLGRLGLREEVPFVRLDPEGFDHVVVAGDRVRIPNGLAKYRERLLRRYPQWRAPILGYFDAVTAASEELDRSDDLPKSLLAALRAAVGATGSATSSGMRGRRCKTSTTPWTCRRTSARSSPVSRATTSCRRGMSRSCCTWRSCAATTGARTTRASTTCRSSRRSAGSIGSSPGCALLLEHEVTRIHAEGGRVTGVTTRDGGASRPGGTSRTSTRAGPPSSSAPTASRATRKRLRYEYSCGTFTMYLGIQGLDLRDHGFGSFNVWHYPHDDLNRMYDDQLAAP